MGPSGAIVPGVSVEDHDAILRKVIHPIVRDPSAEADVYLIADQVIWSAVSVMLELQVEA